ncbi:acyltransferase family protein [Kitasatospora sp. NPDC088346]|uniref:acyltransferase family protein n=1 Tax=Kitasatospora sp. NPDC088346 TaxID=3364073 RepID=UPI00381C5323
MSHTFPASALETPTPQAAPAGTVPAQSAQRSAGPAKSRLGWLDALRGLAALTIVVQHFSQFLLPGVFTRTSHWLDLGSYGVFLFFLVSGYIVPASLERRGSVRGFWLSRLFRIYPLCLAVVGAGVLVYELGAYRTLSPVNGYAAEHPALAALGNLTMLHDFLGMGGVLFVMWTLSYEMAFYFLVAALFVLGVHRRSAEISVAFAVAGVAAVGVFPLLAVTHDQSWIRRSVVLVAAAMAVGLLLVMSRRRPLAVGGALVLAGLSLYLLVANSRTGWFSMAILATMFAGTAFYRAEQGQIGRLKCAVAGAVAFGAIVWVGTRYGEGDVLASHLQKQWPITMAATWATFGIGYALRNRRIPRVFSWLGSISYSIYLVHAVLLCVLLRLVGPHPATSLSSGARIGLGVLFCVVVVLLSHLTFRLVEQPFQRLGHRVTKRVERIGARSA